MTQERTDEISAAVDVLSKADTVDDLGASLIELDRLFRSQDDPTKYNLEYTKFCIECLDFTIDVNEQISENRRAVWSLLAGSLEMFVKFEMDED